MGLGFGVWVLWFGRLGFGVWGLGFGVWGYGLGFWRRLFALCAEGVVSGFMVLDTGGQTRLMRLRRLRRALKAT